MGVRPSQKKCLEYNTKSHLVVRIQFWSSREYEVTPSLLSERRRASKFGEHSDVGL